MTDRKESSVGGEAPRLEASGSLSGLLRLCVSPRLNRANILSCALLMLLCWAGVLIILGPATMGYDTFAQLTMGELQPRPLIPWDPEDLWVTCRYSDHHPLFDTLLFRAFSQASMSLFGSWTAGFVIYIALQSVAMSVTLSLACAYLERFGMPLLFRRLSLAFFCLMPIFPVNAATMVKDTLFIWVFMLWLTLFLEIALSSGEGLARPAYGVALVVLSLLVALTKKTGIYLVIASIVPLLLIMKRNRCWPVGALLGSAAVMWILLPSVVFPALDVVPGGKQEALGTLFQQTARYVTYYGDEVSESQKEIIDRVISYDEIPEKYDERLQDPIKYTYRWQTATGDDLSAYLRVWLEQGLRHPGVYFMAVWRVIEPFFDPTASMNLYFNMYEGVAEAGNTRQFAALDGLRELYAKACNSLSSLPLMGVVFSNLPYLLVPLVSLIALIVRRQLRAVSMVLLVPTLLSCFMACISPVAWTRYVFPLIYMAPLLIAIGFGYRDERSWRPMDGD